MIKKPRRSVIVAFLVLIAVFAAAATAVGFEIEGVTFSETYQANGTNLELRGAGLYRYLVFKVFVSALYLRPTDASADILSDIPKRLVIHYFHEIKAEEFVELTEDGLKKNLSAEKLARIRPLIDRYNTLYSAVKPGDEYSLTYIPGRGTELALNGKPRGVIEGPEFGSAIYTIWLGPNPLEKGLKATLLGR
jgi:hypothetical protein